MSVTRRYHFEAGHWLPNVPEGHKCKRQHGHNYELEVTVSGVPDNRTGFIIDFWDLDKVVHPVIELVDHRNLNDIGGLENPTAENIALWFVEHLWVPHATISRVRVYETKDCWADVEYSAK